MNPWMIQLTSAYNGKPFHINARSIEAILPDKDEVVDEIHHVVTKVYTSRGRVWEVTETPHMILTVMPEADVA